MMHRKQRKGDLGGTVLREDGYAEIAFRCRARKDNQGQILALALPRFQAKVVQVVRVVL
jgi:hypothetical protein